MAESDHSLLIKQKVHAYINVLKENGIGIWRIYLYGSSALGAATPYSDIDVAVFLDKDEIHGFDDDALLMKLRRKVDLDLEPHAFAKSDFDHSNPFIREIINTGKRII